MRGAAGVGLFVALLAGCYRPTLEAECTVACPTGKCPDGLECHHDVCGDPVVCGTGGGDDGGTSEPAPDDSGLGCVGEGAFRYCDLPPPAPGNDIVGAVDTDNDGRCLQRDQGVPACVIVRDHLELDSGRSFGSRAIVFVANTIVINSGKVVSASAEDVLPGPGVRVCSGETGGYANTGAAGGAGGSYMSSGGRGGAGGTGGAGVSASQPNPTAEMAYGGCAGGAGGVAPPSAFAPGGGGGGIIVLIALDHVTIDGAVLACGGYGSTFAHSGGGGGGSGGTILVIAPQILGTGTRLYAVGGGGGGGDNTGEGSEASGQDPFALGGNPGGSGQGGDGFTNQPSDMYGTDGIAAVYGGGGGGGTGRIVLHGEDHLQGQRIFPPLSP